MDASHLSLLAAGIAVVAFLYSSVGHAGASGYIAVLTLAGFAATTVKPVSLVLNVVVAVIATVQFGRAGYFSWRLFWPFALPALPAAALGGYLELPAGLLKPLLGMVLLFSAARLFLRKEDPAETRPPSRGTALGCGAGIGLLSGLTGTGGGIFLTPLMLLLGWAGAKQAAAVSAPFILLNSLAGLAGHLAGGRPVPGFAWWLATVAALAGLAGSQLGSRRLPARGIQLLLATVLVIAGGKLLLAR
jgi:uncharacterized membrane protein YfcA